MPAIQPARLKLQISQLVEHINTPEQFVKRLNDVLFFYADRTRKPGQRGRKFTLTQSYNVPKQVFREMEKMIRPVVSSQPDLALPLADLLWEDGWLESRTLALMVLGWISFQSREGIFPRIQVWAEACKDDQPLLDALADVLAVQWNETPGVVFGLLESWIKNSDPSLRKLGLRLIPSLVQVPSFSYLPSIYTILTPLVQRSGVVPHPDLLAGIRGLAQQSPRETAYFLQKNLAVKENTGVYALIRQSLDVFPIPVKDDLQKLIHKKREEDGGK